MDGHLICIPFLKQNMDFLSTKKQHKSDSQALCVLFFPPSRLFHGTRTADEPAQSELSPYPSTRTSMVFQIAPHQTKCPNQTVGTDIQKMFLPWGIPCGCRRVRSSVSSV